MDDEEALSIAKPAARILSRHPEWAEKITTVSDPVALIVATAGVVIPRVAAYPVWKKLVLAQMQEQQQAAQAKHYGSQQEPAANGTTDSTAFKDYDLSQRMNKN